MSEQLSREEKKYIAALRAQFSYQKACDLIDFTEDVIKPQKEAFKATRNTVQLGKMNNEQLAQAAINTKVTEEENAEVQQ